MDVDVEIQLFGLFYFYAAVEMATLDLVTMAVAAIIAVCGSSFFFFSAAVAAVITVDVSNIGNIQNGDGFIRRLF
jgi:hypothetical protein